MTTQLKLAKMNDQVKELLKGLAEDVKPEVVRIESKLQTTQNHYGDYMSLISSVAKDEKTAKLIGAALIIAGANKQGVISAMNCLYQS